MTESIRSIISIAIQFHHTIVLALLVIYSLRLPQRYVLMIVLIRLKLVVEVISNVLVIHSINNLLVIQAFIILKPHEKGR